MSYLGGINCNLLCAFLCQLYPKACASLLLERFFFILKDWNWPTIPGRGARAASPAGSDMDRRGRLGGSSSCCSDPTLWLCGSAILPTHSTAK